MLITFDSFLWVRVGAFSLGGGTRTLFYGGVVGASVAALLDLPCNVSVSLILNFKTN